MRVSFVEIRLPVKKLWPIKADSSSLGYLYLILVFHLNWDSSPQQLCIAWCGKFRLSETSRISTEPSWNTWANQQPNGQANKRISWAHFDPRDRNIYQRAIDFKAGVLLDTELMCGNLMLKISCVFRKIGRFYSARFWGWLLVQPKQRVSFFDEFYTDPQHKYRTIFTPKLFIIVVFLQSRTKLQGNFKLTTFIYKKLRW
jgi:hypothetical protein